ncbi:hypothetical protein AVEN_83195-1 [Araneus ventricosus]|uniref:Tc1-like transposase DDE domain-containing protein n=1 Tax=Araneus ventricosus TaxID=182803 RepID=A0A4Y2AQ46_ARAVE|nr:hypothetical protein AVEN_83195-1 [Araneus ventricosus]
MRSDDIVNVMYRENFPRFSQSACAQRFFNSEKAMQGNKIRRQIAFAELRSATSSVRSRRKKLLDDHVKHKFDGYRIDKIASETGHKVLRLPPYHCELNPIELIWAQVKGYIARQNQTFKLPEVKTLLLEALDKVSGNDWKNAVAHVTKIEKEFWTMDGLIEDVWEQNELTIQLSDSDSTQESESFSS